MFNSVLVALDDSNRVEALFEAIHQLKLGGDARIILARVIPVREDDIDRNATLPLETASEAASPYGHIEAHVQALQAQIPDAKSTVEVVAGDPAEEIIRLANIHQTDLIILGSRGLTGMNRILQGSVSSQVMAEAPCSVMVIRPREED